MHDFVTQRGDLTQPTLGVDIKLSADTAGFFVQATTGGSVALLKQLLKLLTGTNHGFDLTQVATLGSGARVILPNTVACCSAGKRKWAF